MSKATKRSHLVAAADDTIENIQCRAVYAKWLGALAYTIHSTLEDGKAGIDVRADRAKELASLAQFLADDMTHDLERDAAELQAAIGAAEAGEVDQ